MPSRPSPLPRYFQGSSLIASLAVLPCQGVYSRRTCQFLKCLGDKIGLASPGSGDYSISCICAGEQLPLGARGRWLT